MSSFKPMMGRYSKPALTEGTVLSVYLKVNSPMEKVRAEKRFRDLFHKVGKFAMIDHVILGHLKGIIQANEAVFSLSMTREDVLDESQNQKWLESSAFENFEITLNLMSLIPVELTEGMLADIVKKHFDSVI